MNKKDIGKMPSEVEIRKLQKLLESRIWGFKLCFMLIIITAFIFYGIGFFAVSNSVKNSQNELINELKDAGLIKIK